MSREQLELAYPDLTGKERAAVVARLRKAGLVGGTGRIAVTGQGRWLDQSNRAPAPDVDAPLAGLDPAPRPRRRRPQVDPNAPTVYRQPRQETAAPATPMDRIRAVYASLPRAPGGWVGLAALRANLADLRREDVDAALKALSIKKGVRLAPFDNTRALRAQDKAAALQLGDSPKHMIAIDEPPTPRPPRSRGRLRRTEDRLMLAAATLSDTHAGPDTGTVTLDRLRAALPEVNDTDATAIFDDLVERGMLTVDADGRVRLTKRGRARTPGQARETGGRRFGLPESDDDANMTPQMRQLVSARMTARKLIAAEPGGTLPDTVANRAVYERLVAAGDLRIRPGADPLRGLRGSDLELTGQGRQTLRPEPGDAPVARPTSPQPPPLGGPDEIAAAQARVAGLRVDRADLAQQIADEEGGRGLGTVRAKIRDLDTMIAEIEAQLTAAGISTTPPRRFGRRR